MKPRTPDSHSGRWVDALKSENLLLQLLKRLRINEIPSIPPSLERGFQGWMDSLVSRRLAGSSAEAAGGPAGAATPSVRLLPRGAPVLGSQPWNSILI